MFEQAFENVTIHRDGACSRRGFIRNVGFGAAAGLGLSFTDIMTAQADELRKKGMSMILLWMQGGPSQFETFDPKPDHANGGETETIETALPGVRIAKWWEKTAAAMNDIALVRSVTNKEGNHQRATYQLHTGYVPSGSVKHPSFGSNVAHALGDPKFDLPHIVTIGGRGGESGAGAGFLGVNYEPFFVSNPSQSPDNTQLTVNQPRFARRLNLMAELSNEGYARKGGQDRVRDHNALYKQSSSMILSKHMKAFNLDDEPSELREAYGQTSFGQGCLLARRLVETGVTFVEVRNGNWDTHNDLHDTVGRLGSEVDSGFATLITDLKKRGMLDKTLVVWMGEFGRTPKISGRGGRDHFPKCFNVALAGGGVKGGQVIGASTADGSDVKDRPVQVNDLLTSFCKVLKINPAKENISPQGRPIKVVDGGDPVKELFA